MTPKEKAKALLEKFYYSQSGIEWGNEEQYKEAQSFHDNNSDAVDIYWQTLSKRCALIAVDEMLDFLYDEMVSHNTYQYWREVKNEIELL